MGRRIKQVGQHRTRLVKASTFIRSKAFRLGFESAKRGEPWGAEYEQMGIGDQTYFERGRMLAILAPDVVLMNGRQASFDGVRALTDAFVAGSII